MDRDAFYLSVAHALSGCQLVEQELKLYIAEALALAKKCVGDKFPFKLSGLDFEDAPLERLIETFRRLTDNDALVVDLRKFKAERNYLSHKGIAHCLDFEGELDLPATAEYTFRLTAIQEDAKRLRLALAKEVLSVSVMFDFDD